MPSRLIREGITTSEPLAFVSFQAETLFYRLLVTADDFGLFDARPVIVRARCMPFRDVTAGEVGEWLRELAERSLIVTYEVGGNPYLLIPKFKQRTRNAAPKYPLPDGWGLVDGQVTGNCPTTARHSQPYLGGEGEGVCEGVDVGAVPPAPPPAVTLPLNTGEEFPITVDQALEFGGLYPAVDVMAQLRKMRGWLIANPANRKTKAGILRFVTRWLGQEQDKAGKSGVTTPQTSSAPAGKPKGPSESPLESAVAYARQQFAFGVIDEAERDRRIAEATAKHRSYA